MKKMNLIVILIAICCLFTSCDSPFMHPPTEQEGTIWVSTEPAMFFIIDYREHMGTIGKFCCSEIKLAFGHSYDVMVYDTSKFVTRESDGAIYTEGAIIFRGDCKFRTKKFTIKVTSSEIDTIKVGDKITFNRVDELPEWAKGSAEQNTLPTTATTETG